MQSCNLSDYHGIPCEQYLRCKIISLRISLYELSKIIVKVYRPQSESNF